jgi:predicted DNA-binding protein YlxM (UPF0122 family)
MRTREETRLLREEALDMRLRQGMTLQEIADHFNVGREYIRRCIGNTGRATDNIKNNLEYFQEAVFLYQKLTIADLAKEYRVTERKITELLGRRNAFLATRGLRYCSYHKSIEPISHFTRNGRGGGSFICRELNAMRANLWYHKNKGDKHV